MEKSNNLLTHSFGEVKVLFVKSVVVAMDLYLLLIVFMNTITLSIGSSYNDGIIFLSTGKLYDAYL